MATSTSGWSKVAGKLASKSNGEPLKKGAGPTRAFRLSSKSLKTSLAGAPLENTPAAKTTLPVVSIPGTDGKLHRFTVVDSPVMEPALAKKVAFRSYAGTSVDEPGTTARLDYSAVLGFHASVRSPNGSWNVDPAYAGNTTSYLAHAGSLISSSAEKEVEAQASNAAKTLAASEIPAAGSLVTQRIYRMALANNPGYAELVGAANVDAVKAAIVNRLNGIYNDELGIKFILPANNNLLDFNTPAQFSGANGPCGVNACYTPTATDDLTSCGTIIDQNVPVFDTIIGNENFDIGHILALGATGGVAAGFAGQDSNKAKGCSGAGDGKSDFLAVEFMAHEVGHQFTASHTFSSASCGGFNLPTAVETGSGSSIMSYAGTCAGADNIQQYSDPYFTRASLDQMETYINSTIDPADNGGRPVENGGSTVITTSNHSPIVTVPSAVAIPVRTPFTLTGTATDADGGQIPSNVWEQTDAGTIRPLLDNDKADGALFRSFSQASTPATYESELNAPGENEPTPAGNTRTFPDLAQIAAGNTNAAAGSCPTPADVTNPTQDEKECFAEFLPTTARTMHFDLTARDRFASGGGVSAAETTVTVAGTTPFAETNLAASVAGNGAYTVTWNVAGTTAGPFNVANVKVSYSTDGGLTFPTVLAATTANDGSQSVVIPAGLTTTGRIKVEAIGQPFFDISHADLTVTAPVTTAAPVFTASTPPAAGTVGTAYTYTYRATGNPTPTFAVATGTLPAGLSLNATTGVLSGTPTAAGPYTFTVRASNGIGSPAVTPSTTVTIAAVSTGTAPTISGTPGSACIGTAYTFQFTVTGSPTPTVSVSAGSLPPGLSLSTSGKLSGTPTKTGSFAFTVKATNSAGSATRAVTLTVKPAADLAVTLTGPVAAANNVTFTDTIKVKNNGPSTATSTSTTLPIPDGVTLVSAPGARTVKIKNTTFLVWTASSIAKGSTLTYTAAFKVKATTHATVTIAAGALASVRDPNLGNNAATLKVRLG